MPSSKAALGDNGLPQRLGLGVYLIFSLSVLVLNTLFFALFGFAFCRLDLENKFKYKQLTFYQHCVEKNWEICIGNHFLTGRLFGEHNRSPWRLRDSGKSLKGVPEERKRIHYLSLPIKRKTQYFLNKGQLGLTSGKHSFICYRLHYIRPIWVLESQRFPLYV